MTEGISNYELELYCYGIRVLFIPAQMALF
jgi:hypothetical protein